MGVAKKIKQLVVVTPNKVGMLAELTSLIADRAINIVGICAYSMADKANFMLITEDNEKAIPVLEGKEYEVIKEEEVGIINLSNKPGAAKAIADKLAGADIDLEYCYGTTGDGSESLFIFATRELDRAVEELNK